MVDLNLAAVDVGVDFLFLCSVLGDYEILCVVMGHKVKVEIALSYLCDKTERTVV